MLTTFRKASDSALEEVREEMAVRKTSEIFLLFTMGSQFDHLIKQALEQLGVFCLVADPVSVTVQDVKKLSPIGIIVSGGPASVHVEPPHFDNEIFDLGIPVLGICLGFQMWAKHIGMTVKRAEKREFGVHTFERPYCPNELFEGCPHKFQVLESHSDLVVDDEKDDLFLVSGFTENADVAAASFISGGSLGIHLKHHLYGVQFHPEVSHTEYGEQIFKNFCFNICGARDVFPAADIAKRKIAELREKTRNKRVVLLLSGGSDSSTVAYLLKHAAADNGARLRGVYIKGVDRPDDEEFVLKYFGSQDWIELVIVDATDRFLQELAGKTGKNKRIAFRLPYKAVAEEQADIFSEGGEWEVLIAQGTLYTDISESGGGYDSGARKAVIKVHHNTSLGFSFPELTPLADCVKDSGRNIGRSIGVPEELLTHHPFPGPGLVVRVEGEVTREKLIMARSADRIYIEELRNWNLYDSVWQAGAEVTLSRTTCTMGDDAAEGTVLAIWAVWSVNGFTAQWADLPTDFRRHVSRRITNEIPGVGCVVERISDKPPTTIEWE